MSKYESKGLKYKYELSTVYSKLKMNLDYMLTIWNNLRIKWIQIMLGLPIYMSIYTICKI